MLRAMYGVQLMSDTARRACECLATEPTHSTDAGPGECAVTFNCAINFTQFTESAGSKDTPARPSGFWEHIIERRVAIGRNEGATPPILR